MAGRARRRGWFLPWLQSHGPIEAVTLRTQAGWHGERLPWLQSHGPIEAEHRSTTAQGMTILPWLQSHGPIEATIRLRSRRPRVVLPWLQSHGPIEARLCADWPPLHRQAFRGCKATAPLKFAFRGRNR